MSTKLVSIGLLSISFLSLAGCGGSGVGTSFGKAPGIYFIDGGNNRLVYVSDIRGGKPTIFDSSLTSVSNVVDGTVGPTGHILLIDGNASSIVKFDDLAADGRTVYGSYGAAVGHFLQPVRVTEDAQGFIYVVDAGQNELIRFSPNFSSWNTLDLSTWFAPTDHPAVALDVYNHIFLAGASQVVELTGFSSTGAQTFGSSGTGVGQFGQLTSVAIDSQGRIYLADSANDDIVRINSIAGSGWISYGSAGTGTGNFQAPGGIGVDHDGNIYVGDSGNHRIVEMSDMTGSSWAELDNLPSDTFDSPGTVSPHLPNF